MAEVIPIKISTDGGLAEFSITDKIPKNNIPSPIPLIIALG